MATEALQTGKMVFFSNGCYSDYGVCGWARVLKPIDQEVWEQMTAACTHPPEYHKGGDPRFHYDEALPWFVKNGYVEEVDYQELHLGDYGDTPHWADV